MSESASLARPYVRAVFGVANADNDLASWTDQLELLRLVVSDPQVSALDGHPRVGHEELADLIIGVSGDRLSVKAQNLVRLLATNRRLSVCGEIADQYAVLRAEAENTIDAEVESATELDAGQQKKISEALQSRMGRSVKLHCTTNPDLLGGAVIRTGDWVYDGSVRAQLQKMAAALNA